MKNTQVVLARRPIGQPVKEDFRVIESEVAPINDGEALLDNRLVLRACKAIRAGDEITFDYLDCAHEAKGSAMPSRAERRASLERHFGFVCACRTCGPGSRVG